MTINNTNDNPFVSLDGETPVITEKTINYTEGTGEVPIVPTISVIDVDPEPMIMRYYNYILCVVIIMYQQIHVHCIIL